MKLKSLPKKIKNVEDLNVELKKLSVQWKKDKKPAWKYSLKKWEYIILFIKKYNESKGINYFGFCALCNRNKCYDNNCYTCVLRTNYEHCYNTATMLHFHTGPIEQDLKYAVKFYNWMLNKLEKAGKDVSEYR